MIMVGAFRPSPGSPGKKAKNTTRLSVLVKNQLFSSDFENFWKCARVSEIISSETILSETILSETIWKLLKLSDSFWNYFFWNYSFWN
jgi:hypothetical protein